MKKAVVATFNDKEHAEPILRRLSDAGLHAAVRDETRWQRAHLSEPLASVKIEVPEPELESARAALKECAVCEMEQSVCCPECGSPDVDYPQVTRKFVLPTLHALLFKMGFVEKEFYCNTCQATWALRDKLEHERDALNWPIKQAPLQHNHDSV